MASISDLKKDFKRLADDNKLFQSYIFFGPDQLRQETFALALAYYLENKKWDNSGAVLLDAKVIDANKESGIDAARSISGFLWRKPVNSAKRFLIISSADALTPAAQNAILKIAEEPPEHALLVLILKDPSTLIGSLASRFQKFYFSGTNEGKNTTVNTSLGEARNFFNQFLTGVTIKEKSETLKAMLEVNEERTLMADFVKVALMELRKDLEHNWPVIKNLLQRWTLINQFNTNKKLQLEAALLDH